MKLLLIDQYGELGGGQRCLLDAAQGFHARGWALHAAILTDGPLASALAPYCEAIHPIPCGPFHSTRKTLRDALRFASQIPRQIARVRNIAARARVDALYVNAPRLLPAAALARNGKPLIFHTHWNVPQPSAARLVQWSAQSGNTWLIASSRSAAHPFARVIPGDRVRVVYNGIASFDAVPRPRAAIRHIAVLGRIEPEKGQLEFVRAARLAHAENPALRFTVCGAPMFSGSDYFAQVRREAEGLPIGFPGWNNDVGAWLQTVDLLVVPSAATDNIPRVIPEAYAAGVAVVAFASGGIPELIEDGKTGWLLHDASPQFLAAAILRASREPERINAIALRGHQRWRERYTLDRFQSELCAVVERAVLSHHQRKPLTSAEADPAT